MVRHSNIDLLYKEYKNAQGESEREERYKKLCDEMSKMAYRYASNNRFIGEQNASEFLISVMEKFQSIINNRNNMEVDFALFYARVLEIYTKNYIKNDKRERLYNTSVTMLQGMDIKSSQVKEDYLHDEERANPKLKHLLSSRTVRMYLMTNAALLNKAMLRRIAVAMGADGAEFVQTLIGIQNSIAQSNDIQKNKDLSSMYLIKKMAGEISADNTQRIERYSRLITSHAQSMAKAQKVPYKTVSMAFNIKTSSVSHNVANGRRIVQRYSRNQAEGIIL